MNDHNQRIADEKEIERLACKIRPILYVIAACLILIGMDGILSSYARLKNAEQLQAAQSFAAALNGHSVQMGDDIIRCTITESKLVEGMK